MQNSSHRAGEKIRAWRTQRKLTAEAFAERVPTTLFAVYGWETQGKVARPKAQRRLQEMGVCEAGDWLEPASGEAAPEDGAGQSDAEGDASGSEQVAA